MFLRRIQLRPSVRFADITDTVELYKRDCELNKCFVMREPRPRLTKTFRRILESFSITKDNSRVRKQQDSIGKKVLRMYEWLENRQTSSAPTHDRLPSVVVA